MKARTSTVDADCLDDPVRSSACTEATIRALQILEGKWKLAIVAQLFANDVIRFSELQRSVGGINQKMLIHQLKQLEKDGLVDRTVYPQVPPKVEYSLTSFGRDLGPAIDALRAWADGGKSRGVAS
jgi:DNA-binding HxlR family transcriptional regulator